MSKLRTYVIFTSDAFNTSEPRDYFINPTCFGDDVAKWLIEELKRRGIPTADTPGQEDFGWHFSFHVDDREHDFVLGYRPGDASEEGAWIGWLERKAGFLTSLLGARKRGIRPNAAETIHAVLTGTSRVSHVRWYYEEDFRAGREHLGATSPGAA